MAKTYQDIQNELGVNEENSIVELIAKMNDYNVVSPSEITKIISVSVDRLENQVTGKAKEVKRRMYEPVTDDTKGIVSVLNKRIVLLDMIINKLKLEALDILNQHRTNYSNPHKVTKTQVGLNNVDNTSDLDKPISNATQTALNEISSDLDTHKNNTSNPHNVTKAQVGLSNVLDKEQLGKQEKAVDSDKLNGQKADYYAVKENIENEAAYDLDFSMDSSNYVLTVSLKNKSGVVLTQKSIDLPLETMVIGGRYDNETKKIILTLRGVDNPVEFSVADLISGLQGEINENNKLRVELIDGLTKTYLGLENVINKGMDDKPTLNSDNYVKSGGVYNELNKKIDKSQGSSNANKVFMTDSSGNLILKDTIPSNSLPSTGVSVDTAKSLEKTDGKIISADDAINKPLYNLGAFDTISGNVITRQTGYADLGTLTWIWEANDLRWRSANKISDIYYTNVGSYVPEIKSAKYPTISISQQNQSTSVIGITTYEGYIYLRNGSSTEKPSGIIQYHSTTISYTEEIIEGQPLITLDSQGSQWLRSEWEKGLNLLLPSCFYPKNNIKENGSLGVYEGYSSYYKVPVKPNTNYTISYVGNMIYNLGVATYDVNGNFISYEYWSNSKGTTANNVYFISFNFPNTYTNIMLNKGDHAYPYQPYNSKAHITNYEADFLKEESLKSANLWDEQWESGTLGNNGEKVDNVLMIRSVNYINVKPNTIYTINTNSVVWAYDSKQESIMELPFTNGYTFTTPSNCYYIRFRLSSDYGTTYKNDVMLNKGSTALPYQEYNGSIVREKQLNELDNKKANKSETYTKEETDSALSSAKSYTDTKIANLVGTAPETMDTLEEVANAIKEHQDVADALNAAIGNKANSSDLNAHTGNTSNPHNVTKEQLGLENVDNTKDSDKNVASAKILKNNDIGSFTLSAGVIEGINFADNSVYLIYNNTWCFIMRIGDKNKYFTVQSTVCYNEGSSRPLWFTYNNVNGFKLYLKTTKTTNSNEYVEIYNTNETFNYKLLSN